MATLLVMGSRAANDRGNDVDLAVELPPKSTSSTDSRAILNQKPQSPQLTVKVAVVQLAAMNLPMVQEDANVPSMGRCTKVGDVAICRLSSIEEVLAAVKADQLEAMCVIEAPRSAHTISTAPEGVYQLSTDSSVAPPAPELPKPEYCSGASADMFSWCLLQAIPCVIITGLTSSAPAAGVTRSMLRTMTSTALQAVALLLHGSTTAAVPGLRSVKEVEDVSKQTEGSTQVTIALDAQIKGIRASPLAHTAVRMFA